MTTAAGVGLGVGSSLVIVGTMVLGYFTLRPERPPGPCVDSAELITTNASERECTHGQHRMEVYPAGSLTVLVKCVCREVKP